jgi:hypothetical protein
MVEYERIVLLYYMEDAALWYPGNMPAGAKHERESVVNLKDEQVKGTPGSPGIYDKAMAAANALTLDRRDHQSDQATYQMRVEHCRARINIITPSGVPLYQPLNLP